MCALPAHHHHLLHHLCSTQCAREILIDHSVPDDLRTVLDDPHMRHPLGEQLIAEELPSVEDHLEVGRLSRCQRRQQRLNIHHREGRELGEAHGGRVERRGEA